jgi:hypothetical protein
MPQPLLFPLNRLSQVDVAALQVALRAPKLLQPAFMRQRMRSIQGRLVPDIPVNRPWNAIGTASLTDLPAPCPSVVHELKPYPPTYFRLTGITRDATGAPLGNCVVHWFDATTDRLYYQTTSDANGAFEFREAGQPPNAYYLVAYKPGSPAVAGTTVNTLVGT